MAKKQKLKLLMNIGKLDADQLGLDHSLEGESVSVDEKTAEILVKNGWASKSRRDHVGPHGGHVGREGVHGGPERGGQQAEAIVA